MTRDEMGELAISTFINNSEPTRDLILLGQYLLHIDDCEECDFSPRTMFATEMSDAILHAHTSSQY